MKAGTVIIILLVIAAIIGAVYYFKQTPKGASNSNTTAKPTAITDTNAVAAYNPNITDQQGADDVLGFLNQ